MFPKEIWRIILRRLDVRDLLAAKMISREIRNLAIFEMLAKFENDADRRELGRHLKTKIILIHNYVGKIAALDENEIIACAFNSAYVAQNDAIMRAISAKFRLPLIKIFLICLYKHESSNMMYVDKLPDNICRLIRYLAEKWGIGEFVSYLSFYRCWDSEIAANISVRMLMEIDYLEEFEIQMQQLKGANGYRIFKKIKRITSPQDRICL